MSESTLTPAAIVQQLWESSLFAGAEPEKLDLLYLKAKAISKRRVHDLSLQVLEWQWQKKKTIFQVGRVRVVPGRCATSREAWMEAISKDGTIHLDAVAELSLLVAETAKALSRSLGRPAEPARPGEEAVRRAVGGLCRRLDLQNTSFVSVFRDLLGQAAIKGKLVPAGHALAGATQDISVDGDS